ncbi:MAG: GrpB family protein [Clostridia bacterium]|nr:GrpB family protein [Clostridia bacterium]
MANIIEYNHSLPDVFKKESKVAKKLLGFNCKGIHHIGSTAVNTVAPSKTIDMLAVVKDLEKIGDNIERLNDSGYINADETCPENGYLFIKNGGGFDFHLYVFQVDDLDSTEGYVAVRDYLRNHKDAAGEYSSFKTKALTEDPAGYEKAKSEYLDQLEKKAVKWQRTQNRKVVCISLGMCLGSGIGCALGASSGNMALGVSLGISIGVAIGIACGIAFEKKG